jgi:peptidoglycan/LPS O-acetylase OafA/YrhL
MSKLPHGSRKLVYRPDIDGLRAVAVLLVLAQHLRTRISGGFIGVDVFFVISGYLISAAILSEMASGTFSIIGFYDRRIRRIFPALIVVLLSTSVMAYRYFVPSELIGYAHALLAALGSVSNILFWTQTGYFDGASDLNPLLHTWSLAVEEQFYIFFPIFLILVRRWLPHRIKAAIWTVTLVTFVLACIWVGIDSSTAFFLAPLRAWELLIGTIVSQNYLPSIQGRLQRNLASLTGILLILIPSVFLQAESVFPGVGALAPCIGAALIIMAGENGSSIVGSVLSWRPIVFIGLISYSLYLWHWPIIVFQTTNSMLVASTGRGPKLAVLAVSLLLATLSWRFVETPFRKGRLRPGRKSLFIISGTAVAAVAAVGVFIIAEHGLPSRFPQAAIAVSQWSSYDHKVAFREGSCFIDSKSTFDPSTCLKEDPTRKQYLLLGDSHAAQMYTGFRTVFSEINLLQANVADCRPLLSEPVGKHKECYAMSSFIFGDYLLHHRVDTVLLAGRWKAEELPALGKTIAWLQQRQIPVVLFGPSIEWDAPLPRVLAISIRDRNASEIESHRATVPQELDQKMTALAQDQWHVPYVSEFGDLCTAEAGAKLVCPAYAKPGVPLLSDGDHLTMDGSILFAETMRIKNQFPL